MEDSEHCQRASANFLKELRAILPKAIHLTLQDKFLDFCWIASDASITGAHTFYIDANKSGKASYKLGE